MTIRQPVSVRFGLAGGEEEHDDDGCGRDDQPVGQGRHLLNNYSGINILKLSSGVKPDGIIDIYLPDTKCASKHPASNTPDYLERHRNAVREMHRQVCDLHVRDDGTAVKGLLVRHLVFPEGVSGNASITRFPATEISRRTVVNAMDQNRPEYRARECPEIARTVSDKEFLKALEAEDREGLSPGTVILQECRHD